MEPGNWHALRICFLAQVFTNPHDGTELHRGGLCLWLLAQIVGHLRTTYTGLVFYVTRGDGIDLSKHSLE